MKKTIEKLKYLSFAVVAASTPPPPEIKPITSPVDPKTVVIKLINYSLFFIGAIALIFVIWGGIQYVTSGGDSEKTTKARNTLLYAIIGIVVVVLAWAIVSWAANVFAPTVTK